jgi:hypothetical protein
MEESDQRHPAIDTPMQRNSLMCVGVGFFTETLELVG